MDTVGPCLLRSQASRSMDVVALIPPPTRLGVLVPGYILISHPVHSAIGHEEMRAALP